METPKAPDAARGEMIIIGQSVVIKGELSCGEDLFAVMKAMGHAAVATTMKYQHHDIDEIARVAAQRVQ